MTTPTAADLNGNLLLGKLNEADRARLTPHFLVFDLAAGEILQETGQDVTETWFPCRSAMAAFSVPDADGAEGVEVALVGREGAIGGIVSNGNLPAYGTARVRFSGRFLRVKTTALEQAKQESVALRHWFSRYSDYLLAQVFQTAACNATHTITQRTAKWLLAAVSRSESDELALTQAELAGMLGVGRTFVTHTIRHLRDQGFVSTRRGVIVVRDTPALRRLTCHCATALEEHFHAVLHGIYPRE